MSFDTKTKRFVTPSMAELAYLAALISTEAPVRNGDSRARIPWEYVIRIRELLAKDGMDWKKAAAEHKKLDLEERRAKTAKRYQANAIDAA